jgi:GntR family transcriptional regulator / MocR family aminotransferase
VRRMRRVYKHRRDVLLEALDRYFGSDAVVRGDAAGLHMTVRFRHSSSVRKRAERNGVELTGTGIYYLSKPAPDEFILGFSAIGERTICEAVRHLVKP